MGKVKRSGKIQLTPGSSLFPIFKVVEGELVIARENIIGMYPFCDILARDKSEGKKRAYQEFMYIYLMYDINSEFEGLPVKERLIKSIKACSLEMDYEPDALVLQARNSYEEIYAILNPQVKMYLTLRRGLKSGEKVISNVIEKIEELIEQYDVRKEGQANEIGNMVTLLNTLNSLAGQFPSAIANIDSIYKSIKESDAQLEAEVYGGGTRFSREDPDYIAKKFGSLRDDDSKAGRATTIGIEHEKNDLRTIKKDNPVIGADIETIRSLGLSNE
jgi:hypothetical protein